MNSNAGEWTYEAFLKVREKMSREWEELGFYENRSLSEALVSGANAYPDTLSLYYSEGQPKEFTNRDFLRESMRVASALHSMGIGEHDVVAVQLPTWWETTIVFQAIAHVGAVVLPIIVMYGRKELNHILKESRAKALFIPRRWKEDDSQEKMREMKDLPHLENIIYVRGEVKVPSQKSGPVELGWDQLVARGDSSFTPETIDPHAPALLMFTSGTTSAPKGVIHSSNTLLCEWSTPNYKNRGLYLSSLPVGHYSGYGYAMRPTIYGAPMVFLDRWDAGLATRLIHEYKIIESGGTPLFLKTLLDAAEDTGADISSLAHYTLGGQGMSPSLIERAVDKGILVGRVYGSTEHPTVSRCDWQASQHIRTMTDGLLDEGNSVRVVDENGVDVPAGADGELLTKGPEMLLGYMSPSATLDAFTPDGWFRTGDIGHVTSDNHIVITDRKKDIIIRGGENLSSVEIEEAMRSYPGVLEAAVVAMPDDVYGEKVCAFAVVQGARSVSTEEMREHFRSLGIGYQKSPEHIEIIDAMPRNNSGKIMKYKLRKIAEEIAQKFK